MIFHVPRPSNTASRRRKQNVSYYSNTDEEMFNEDTNCLWQEAVMSFHKQTELRHNRKDMLRGILHRLFLFRYSVNSFMEYVSIDELSIFAENYQRQKYLVTCRNKRRETCIECGGENGVEMEPVCRFLEII